MPPKPLGWVGASCLFGIPSAVITVFLFVIMLAVAASGASQLATVVTGFVGPLVLVLVAAFPHQPRAPARPAADDARNLVRGPAHPEHRAGDHRAHGLELRASSPDPEPPAGLTTGAGIVSIVLGIAAIPAAVGASAVSSRAGPPPGPPRLRPNAGPLGFDDSLPA